MFPSTEPQRLDQGVSILSSSTKTFIMAGLGLFAEHLLIRGFGLPAIGPLFAEHLLIGGFRGFGLPSIGPLFA